MFKRFVSAVLSVCMLTSMLSAPSYAQETVSVPVQQVSTGEAATPQPSETPQPSATPQPSEEPAKLSEGQQAFVDAVSALDEDALLALAEAYKADPKGENAEAMDAAYADLAAAQALYDALTDEEQAEEQVAASKADLDALLAAMDVAAQSADPETGDTLEISTAAELLDFAAQVNGTGDYEGAADDFADKTVTLTGNIDLSTVCQSGGANWTPIGTAEHPFSGTFDGQEHNVTNLYIATGNPEPAMGLFGVISAATVKNVNLSVSILVSNLSTEVGGLAGKALGSTIQDCTVGGSINATTATDVNAVGGIVGFLGSDSIVKDCSNSCAIASTSTLVANMGGIAGSVQGADITGCSNSGAISGGGKMGGVAGYVAGEGEIFQDCTNTAGVRVKVNLTKGSDIGGIVGYVSEEPEGVTVKNCANTGEISAVNGWTGYSSCTAGGVVGKACNKATVESCYNTGNVVSGTGSNGNCIAGGVVGLIISGEVKSCYSTGAIKADGTSGIAGGVAAITSTSAAVVQAAVTVKNCYSTGEVTSAGTAGYAGGVVGSAQRYSFIQYCMASGAIQEKSKLNTYAGGVIGYASKSSTVSNCVALNPSVYGGVYADAQCYTSPPGEENYYWEGMEVSNQDGTVDHNSSLTALSYNSNDETLSVQFSTIFGSDNTAWTYTDNGLPTLKDVGGEQSSIVPMYILYYVDDCEISTAAELLDFAAQVNGTGKYEGAAYNFAGKNVILTKDIDLSSVCGETVGEGGTNWTPIGTVDHPFSGTFDGQLHRVTKLYIKTDAYKEKLGLFGVISDATVKKLSVEPLINVTGTAS